MENRPMIDRRDLLVLLTGAALSIVSPARGVGGGIRGRVRAPMVINSCGGFDDSTDIREPAPNHADSGPRIDHQVVQDAIASGMTAVNQTIGYVFGDKDPFEQTVTEVATWDRLIRNDPQLLKVHSVQDIERCKRNCQLGLILGFQNAAMLGNKLNRIDTFTDFGIKIMQLTYNNQNLLGGGCLTAGNPGLAPFGHDVVERLNTLRVIVDLSHSGDQTCLDAARKSVRPIAVTHTGCRALVDHPRNTTDEALRLVASKGGYVGIYFMPYLAAGRNATPEDVIAHLEHAIQVCGEDHVGIGTDGGTSTIDLGAAKIERARLYAQRRAAGIATPGESPNILNFIPELTGPDQFRSLASLLALRGHSTARIEKILGINFLRYARDAWGA
jgi:membrane dipeptidase